MGFTIFNRGIYLDLESIGVVIKVVRSICTLFIWEASLYIAVRVRVRPLPFAPNSCVLR